MVGEGEIVDVVVSVSVCMIVELASGVVTTMVVVVVVVVETVVVGVATVTVVVFEAVLVNVTGMKLSTSLRQVTAAGQLEGAFEPGAGHVGRNEDFLDTARAFAFGLRERLFL